ncbi:pheophytinase, chloroplastic-like [Miscanthus floridulus]|uniref:pheophytinase, chloroplastic-like n=1 Tax=Miscanthus floridulus TaxID=154761 RepID=UPI0034586952
MELLEVDHRARRRRARSCRRWIRRSKPPPLDQTLEADAAARFDARSRRHHWKPTRAMRLHEGGHGEGGRWCKAASRRKRRGGERDRAGGPRGKRDRDSASREIEREGVRRGYEGGVVGGGNESGGGDWSSLVVTFHLEKQLRDLGRDHRVWTMDFLGQGMSLPGEDPSPSSIASGEAFWGFGQDSQPWVEELVYSVDLWQNQVQHFIEEVIREPVYIVGNSLGGFVALYFAASSPHLVKGVTLLNATPFWGFFPNPATSPRLSKIFPWAGTFSLPSFVRKLTEAVWQKISDPKSIQDILKQVYADHSTNVDKVFSHIVEITQHPAAAASFASIMFAPRGQISFQEAISRCQSQGVPLSLMYGREDPWIRPFWGIKVKQQVPEAPYYEISPASHCPHDEVPEVINYLLRGWLKNLESEGSIDLPFLEEPSYAEHGVSRELEFVREGSRKSVSVRLYGTKISLWSQISSFLNTHVPNSRVVLR